MENRPSNKHLFFRSFLIYIITILSGTLITSLIMSDGGQRDFELFISLGLAFTGLAAMPNILFLFLGFRYIYKKYHSFRKIYTAHFILGLILCILPVILFIIVMLGSIFVRKIDEEIFLFFLMAVPYDIIALLSILGINYFFDKGRDFKESFEEDDNLLDDMK